MPESAIEVVPLDEADLDAAPPCEGITSWRWLPGMRWRWRRCGRPATRRVKVTCPVHGSALKFLCSPHLRVLKLGLAGCWTCDHGNPVRFSGHS